MQYRQYVAILIFTYFQRLPGFGIELKSQFKNDLLYFDYNNSLLNDFFIWSHQHFGVWPLLRILAPKQPDHTWLCTCVTRAPKVVESCSKAQKTWQVF